MKKWQRRSLWALLIVMIIPSRKLVVVRCGLTLNPADMGFESFLSDVLGALPK
jgi:hypothetical protein